MLLLQFSVKTAQIYKAKACLLNVIFRRLFFRANQGFIKK